MSLIPSRLLGVARPGCEVRSFSLRLALNQTSRSLTYSRRVPGLGEQTPLRDTSAAQSSRKAHISPPRQTRSTSEDADVNSTNDYFVYRDGRKQDFYEYFLQRDYFLKAPLKSPWILSFDAHPKLLPTELAQDPLRAFDDTGADLDLAKLCLQTFVARVHREHGNGPQARELYRSNKIGSRALLWFLDHAFETVDIAIDRTWPQLLAHCLVAQDDTYEVLHHWLTVEHRPKYAAVWNAKEQNRWRSRILQAAIDSIVYWATDVSAGFNDALKFYNFVVVEKSNKTRRVPYFGAGTTLDSYLSNFDTSKVDVSELEKFMWSINLWVPPGTLRHSWTTARLKLNHPSGPQPQVALNLFLHLDANRADFFQTTDGPFNLSIKATMVRTAQVLQSMGRKRDARRILLIGRKRLPTYLYACKVTDKNRDMLDRRAVARVFGESCAETTGRLRVLQDESQTNRAIKMELLRNR